MIGNNPETATDIISNLMVINAFPVQDSSIEIESIMVHKFTSKFISFEHVHECKGVGMK